MCDFLLETTKRSQSDLDSINTEDFEQRFMDIANTNEDFLSKQFSEFRGKMQAGSDSDNREAEGALSLRRPPSGLHRSRGDSPRESRSRLFGGSPRLGSDQAAHQRIEREYQRATALPGVREHARDYISPPRHRQRSQSLESTLREEVEASRLKQSYVQHKMENALSGYSARTMSEARADVVADLADLTANSPGSSDTEQEEFRNPRVFRNYAGSSRDSTPSPRPHRLRSDQPTRPSVHIAAADRQLRYETDVTDPPETEIEEEAAAVRAEFHAIQQQIKRERRLSGSEPKPSINSGRSSTSTSPQRIDRNSALQELQTSLIRTRQDKLELLDELSTLQETLRIEQQANRKAQEETSQTVAKQNQARSDLLLAEFKRDSAIKEHEKMSEELAKKERRLDKVDRKLAARKEELRALEDLGIDKDRVQQILGDQERLQEQLNDREDLKANLRCMEEQLIAAKQEVEEERTRSKQRLNEMQLELERGRLVIQEAQLGEQESGRKVENLHRQLDQLERDKERIEREKNREIERVQERLECLLRETRSQYEGESCDLRDQINQLMGQLSEAQTSNHAQKEQLFALKQQNKCLEDELTRSNDSRARMIEEHEQSCQQLRNDRDASVAQQQELGHAEKEAALDEARRTAEKQLEEALHRTEERQNTARTEYRQQLGLAQQRIEELKDKLTQQEEETRQLTHTLKVETKEQIRQSVRAERELWEVEADRLMERNLAAVERDRVCLVQQLEADVCAHRRRADDLQAHLDDANRELDEYRASGLSYTDRVTALNRVKETAREEKQREMEKIKNDWLKDHSTEVERLREQCKRHEAEVRELRGDRLALSQSQRDLHSQVEKIEKTLLHEINEECRRTANLMGVTPRRVTYSSSQSPSKSAPQSALDRSSKPPTSTSNATINALANLRAHNEEIRQLVKDIRKELETQKSKIDHVRQEKQQELQELKQRLDKERNTDLENLKQRLIQENIGDLSHLISVMSQIRAKTSASKSSKRSDIDHNLLQREVDRLQREVERLRKSQTQAMLNSSAPALMSLENNSTIKELQGRVAASEMKLRTPRTDYTISEASLSPRSVDSDKAYIKNLEQRISASQKQAELAEQRSRAQLEETELRNCDAARLQEKLQQQTKHIAQLERAYSQLQQSSVAATS